jgi:sec-independent protein translocase protein TatC
MTLAEHLAEVIATASRLGDHRLVFGVVAFIFYPQILNFLQEPYCAARSAAHKGCTFLVTPAGRADVAHSRSASSAVVPFASPVLFWQLWRFITPGLKARERKYIVPSSRRHCVLHRRHRVAYFSFGHAIQFLESIGGKSLADSSTTPIST